MIMGLMNVIDTFNRIVLNIEKNSDKLDKAETLKEMAKTINDIETSGSMLRVLSNYIVEPTVIVSDTLKTEEITDKVIKLNIDIFASFYMQVFTILTNVQGLSSSVAINTLSTSTKLGLEEVNIKDPIAEKLIDGELNMLPIKKGVEKLIEANEARASRNNARPGATSSNSNNSSNKTSDNNSNDETRRKLAGHVRARDARREKDFILPSIVQREIEITVTAKDKNGVMYPIVIPILIKAHVVYVNFETIHNMLSLRDGSKTFMERLDSYRAGAISLSDLIFATDLIKEYKESRLKDNDDIIKQMNRRVLKSNIKLLENSKAGFEKYYNCVIVNEQEKLMIENIVRGKLSKRKYKETALERMLAMLLTVVDRDYEMISIYTKDINANTEMTFKSLKKKDDKSSLEDIFKNMVSNKPLF